MLNFKKFEYQLPDSPWWLPDSPSREVHDSPISWVGESPTLRLAKFFFWKFKSRLGETVSCRLPDSPSRRVSEFDYEYLLEFEAKSGTARKVVWWMYEDPISAKTPKNPPHCHVPLKFTIRSFDLKGQSMIGYAKANTRLTVCLELLPLVRLLNIWKEKLFTSSFLLVWLLRTSSVTDPTVDLAWPL
jgi:hypothetical protein